MKITHIGYNTDRNSKSTIRFMHLTACRSIITL